MTFDGRVWLRLIVWDLVAEGEHETAGPLVARDDTVEAGAGGSVYVHEAGLQGAAHGAFSAYYMLGFGPVIAAFIGA